METRNYPRRQTGVKWCCNCNEEKPVGEFPSNRRHRDGLSSWCRKCRQDRRAETRILYDPQMEGEKVCRVCGEEKPRTEFWADSTYRDGRKSICKVCDNQRKKERRYKKHPPRTEGTKVCHLCKEEKPVSEFHRSPKSIDGLDVRCKPCRAAQRKKRSDQIKAKKIKEQAEKMKEEAEELTATTIEEFLVRFGIRD